jgi:hypothetical protein
MTRGFFRDVPLPSAKVAGVGPQANARVRHGAGTIDPQ